MKILPKYVARCFLVPYVYGLVVFSLLIALVHVFEKLDIFANHKPSIWDILCYVGLLLPSWMVQVLPVGALLACFWGLGRFVEGGEYIAARSGGINPKEITAPLFLLAFAAGLISFLTSEWIVPRSNAAARMIYTSKIKKSPIVPQHSWSNILVAGREGRIYRAQSFNLETATLERIIISKFQEGHKVEQIDALKAQWNGSQWIIRNGVLRTFYGLEMTEQPFTELAADIPERPRDLVPETLPLEEASTAKLRQQIEKCRRLGLPHRPWSIALSKKYAAPWANAMVMFIAIPLALRMKKAGRMKSFTYTIGFAFLYWGIMSAGENFAQNQAMPVWLGVWLANIFFGLFGLYFFRKYV